MRSAGETPSSTVDKCTPSSARRAYVLHVCKPMVGLAFLAQASAFTDHGLASLLWAFGTLNHVPGPALLGPIEAEIQRRSGEMEMTHVVQLLWGFATLSHVPHPAVCAALQVRSGCSRSRRRLVAGLLSAEVTPDPRNSFSGLVLGKRSRMLCCGCAVCSSV